MNNISRAAHACACVLLSVSPLAAATISLGPGGNLQQAINSAQPGDTIALAAGATFTGNFTLPNKSGAALITIRTAGDAGLPGDGGRVSPANVGALAVIRSGNGSAAIQTVDGAHHWRLLLLEVQANAGGNGDIITLGDGSSAQRSLAQIPHDLTVDRVYVHGDPNAGQKRGIALNSASTTITGSYVSDIKALGQDSQAIGGWNGPGPYTITNNYLEAAAENLMFGGADPAVPNLVPSDITITGNLFSKPTAWRSEGWVVKNLIELKNARRVMIAGNTFEYNWQGGQSGFAIVFTVRNQDGGCPWCQVDHVTFQQNLVRHSAAGIQILGFDNNHPSQQTQAIIVRDNVFADIDTVNWGGNGYFLSLTGGARDITIDHNTIASDHSSGVVQADGAPVLGFTFTNNLAKHNSYGFIGTDHGVGNDTIAAYFPGSDITRNILAGGVASHYPGGNSFPSVAQFEGQFVSYGGGDYHLIAGSPWRGAGLDGGDLGALFDVPIGSGTGAGAGAPPAPRVVLTVGNELPPGVVGAAYTGVMTVAGGSGPYTWTVTAGALPEGLSLDAASGTIGGTPSAYGSFAFSASVKDGPSGAQASLDATVVIAPPPLSITTASLPQAYVGQPYTATLTAIGGAPPVRWAIAGSGLPLGLTLDPATGVISGTPSRFSRISVAVTASDQWTTPQTTMRTFTIDVLAKDRPQP